MQRHNEGVREKDELMVHPLDGDAWKEMDTFYPDFAAEPSDRWLHSFWSNGIVILMLARLCYYIQPSTLSLYEI
jgi:hypothetical protein